MVIEFETELTENKRANRIEVRYFIQNWKGESASSPNKFYFYHGSKDIPFSILRKHFPFDRSRCFHYRVLSKIHMGTLGTKQFWVDYLDSDFNKFCPLIDNAIYLKVLEVQSPQVRRAENITEAFLAENGLTPVEEEFRAASEVEPFEFSQTTVLGTSSLEQNPGLDFIQRAQLRIEQREKEEEKQRQEKVVELRNKLATESLIQDKKNELSSSLRKKVDTWCENSYGATKDIRSLLSSLDSIWSKNPWKCDVSDVLEERQVKVKYKKAMLMLHPDKLSRCTDEEKVLGELVFDVLNKQFKSFEQNSRS
eukprot:snap_masked-scaffold_9-processed-gene-4.26-mRNA-1 protein AED:1.00 eAED:1.00 QI:0/-1/0/0/-1/1/1/0/308